MLLWVVPSAGGQGSVGVRRCVRSISRETFRVGAWCTPSLTPALPEASGLWVSSFPSCSVLTLCTWFFHSRPWLPLRFLLPVGAHERGGRGGDTDTQVDVGVQAENEGGDGILVLVYFPPAVGKCLTFQGLGSPTCEVGREPS